MRRPLDLPFMTLKDTLGIGASIVASLGGGGAIVFGLSNYLGKVWADRALEAQRRENARLNLELTHQLAIVTEQVKTSLQIAALEHQVRFSRLHEKRANAIEELHERAHKLQVEAERYSLSFVRGGQEAYERIVADIREFDAFCESHRIYLSDEMEDLLYTFLETVKKPMVDIGVYSE